MPDKLQPIVGTLEDVWSLSTALEGSSCLVEGSLGWELGDFGPGSASGSTVLGHGLLHSEP